ncbi:hypothetical protein N7474_007896 [Penicillium riverlandense]|uniref:uncharacterized protein n=1 Tax=Penicillium riverlandense TaxID=1903569 RepID=UPI0025491E02|nr:uncharacterized protein N7474_007896 [Penicillium riverlandense]KAJ5811595.1 hypothetical protein N7474_007896 [Penicillium riverlandense]
MKPTLWALAALTPTVALAASPPPSSAQDLSHNGPVSADVHANAPSIPDIDLSEIAPRRAPPLPFLSDESLSGKLRASRHLLQARSEGTLGQTPWIGMAIGLTFTALAAVMLG